MWLKDVGYYLFDLLRWLVRWFWYWAKRLPRQVVRSLRATTMIRFAKEHIFSLSGLFFLAALGFVVVGVFALWAAALDIPALDTFDERIVQQSTKIYDRTGEVLLYDVHENVQRTVVPYEDISRHMKNATVAIEDAEFYEHRGVKITSTLRAILTNLLSADLLSGQGGSTITQQVVKNTLLTQEKLISRKFKEWVLAIKLENTLSKEDILALYLNEVPYGGNLYGVEEASMAFFDKRASDLTVAESAYLAALPQAPTYYSPYGQNTEALENRKNIVLSRMRELGFITNEEYEEAQEEEILFQPRADLGIQAPHFVFYIIEQLEQEYGRRALETEGFRVITTLDYDLQKQAEEIVKRHALSNETNFNAENAALVAIDPNNGDVLTMVGSRDYFDEAIDGKFNVALAERQPGSAFKPFVYATAFKEGYTDQTVVFDLSTQFSTACEPASRETEFPCYRPVNYDGVFRGPVTFRNALAQSINIPAVKVLYLAGLDNSLKTARDLGITTLTNRDQYGLTLVLGGGEVTPFEMASAYGVFATGGIRNEPRSIIRIEDRSGSTVADEQPLQPRRVLGRDVALLTTDILADNEARAPAFGSDSYLHFPNNDVAVKTGTTNNYRDAWIVGYTPNISVATWAGNNNNESMEKRVAGFIVAPMWNEFMQYATAQRPQGRFEQPAPESDRLAGLKLIMQGVWQGGEVDDGDLEIDVHSILHWVDTDNPLGSVPQDPARDPQYSRWELSVRSWASANGYSGGTTIPAPTHLVEDTEIEFEFDGIKDGDEIEIDEEISFELEGDDIDSVTLYINNVLIEDDSNDPFSFSFTPNELGAIDNTITLRLLITTENGQTQSEVLTLFVEEE